MEGKRLRLVGERPTYVTVNIHKIDYLFAIYIRASHIAIRFHTREICQKLISEPGPNLGPRSRDTRLEALSVAVFRNEASDPL